MSALRDRFNAPPMSPLPGEERTWGGSRARVGSTSDSRDLPLPRLLSGVKQTQSARKRTWGLNVACWGKSGRCLSGAVRTVPSQEQKFGYPFEVTTTVLDIIPRSGAGKFQDFISKVEA